MKLRPRWERPGAEPFSPHTHRGGEEDLTRRRRASPPSLSQVPRERSLGPHEVSVEELSCLAAASLAGLSSDSAATVTYLCGETPGAAGPGVVEEELPASSLRRKGCVSVARPAAEAGLELFTELQSQDSSSRLFPSLCT